jgi:hypothetical protein
LFKDFFSHAFKRWSTVFTIEFDTEIFSWTSWVVTGRKYDTTEAITFTIYFIETSNHSRYSRSRKKAMLSNDDLSDTITESNLDTDLGSNIIIVSSVSRNNHGFALIFIVWESVENGLNKVLKIVLLSKNSNLLSKSTSSWLLVSIWLSNFNNFL